LGPSKVLHLAVKFKALKSLKWFRKIKLTMISRGLKFGDGKNRIVIWLNVTIKLQKAIDCIK